MTRWVQSLLPLLLLPMMACSPATGGTWTRPNKGLPAPAEPPTLVTVGAVHLHQVLIESPTGSHVMIGRLRFPNAHSWRLVAEASVGMRLFTVGHNGQTFEVDVAAPLRGKIPAERLAREIHAIYFDDDTAVRAPTHRTVDIEGGTLTIDYSDYGWWGPAWLPRKIHVVGVQSKVSIVLVGYETDI